jgi:hypothetical protein
VYVVGCQWQGSVAYYFRVCARTVVPRTWIGWAPSPRSYRAEGPREQLVELDGRAGRRRETDGHLLRQRGAEIHLGAHVEDRRSAAELGAAVESQVNAHHAGAAVVVHPRAHLPVQAAGCGCTMEETEDSRQIATSRQLTGIAGARHQRIGLGHILGQSQCHSTRVSDGNTKSPVMTTKSLIWHFT